VDIWSTSADLFTALTITWTSATCKQMQVSRTKMSTYRRGFEYAGPSTCNALPNTLKMHRYCLSTFRRPLNIATSRSTITPNALTVSTLYKWLTYLGMQTCKLLTESKRKILVTFANASSTSTWFNLLDNKSYKKLYILTWQDVVELVNGGCYPYTW